MEGVHIKIQSIEAKFSGTVWKKKLKGKPKEQKPKSLHTIKKEREATEYTTEQ